MASYAFELNGVRRALLMHADDVLASDTLSEWRKDRANKSVSVPGDDRSPAWTWMTYLYVDDQHRLTMPVDNIMACLRNAGARVTLKGNKSFKELTQSSVFLDEESCEFLVKGKPVSYDKLVDLRDLSFRDQFEAVKKFGFRLLVKRACVNKAKHVRVRACFDNWTVKGTLESMDAALTAERLAELFDIAGRFVGLGDWRPGGKTPGPHGMFQAVVKPL